MGRCALSGSLSFVEGLVFSMRLQSLNSLTPTTMFTSFLSFGLHALMAASLSLKPQQGIDMPSNTSSSNPISNAHNSGNETSLPPTSVQPISALTSNRSRLLNGIYRCDGDSFGFPSIESCRDAYGWIRASGDVRRFGDRTAPGAVDVPLPYRYSSSA